MLKIGLCGGAGSGKDTVASLLVQNWYFKRFAFADRLKYEYGVQKGYQGTLEEVIALVNQEKDREGLIYWGEFRRKENPLYWIEWVDKDINSYLSNEHERMMIPRDIVITDLRHDNELDYCRSNGFYIVKVDAPLELRIERMKKRGDRFDESFLNHHTEKFVEKVDADLVIDNSGTIDDLKDILKDMVFDFLIVDVYRAKNSLLSK